MKLYITASFHNFAKDEVREQKTYLTEADLIKILMTPIETAYANDSETLKKIKLTKLSLKIKGES